MESITFHAKVSEEWKEIRLLNKKALRNKCSSTKPPTYYAIDRSFMP